MKINNDDDIMTNCVFIINQLYNCSQFCSIFFQDQVGMHERHMAKIIPNTKKISPTNQIR